MRKVYETMKGYGLHVQYSVFLCDLTLKWRAEMFVDLAELINHDEDRIMIIDLGPNDGTVVENIRYLGQKPEFPARDALIF